MNKFIFDKISNTQYVVRTEAPNKFSEIIGNLICDSTGEWGLFIDRRNVFLLGDELNEIQNKIKDLKHEAKISPNN